MHEQLPQTTRSSTMRAARIVGPGILQLQDVALPQPGPGQLRFRVRGCCVGPATVDTWRGTDGEYPLAAGASEAEAWGVVDALGEHVSGWKVGEPLGALSANSLAEYDVVDASAALRLPDALANVPFPSSSLAGAINVFEQCRLEPAQSIAIVGVGFLGALLTRLASHAGARVLALARRPFSLSVAREMGASSVIELEDTSQVLRQVQSLTHRRLCDVVVEATGEQAGLDWASSLLATGGRLVIAGRHRAVRQVDMRLWSRLGLDVVNAHETELGARLNAMRMACEAISSGRLPSAHLYTHRFQLGELESALSLAERRPVGFVKAFITP